MHKLEEDDPFLLVGFFKPFEAREILPELESRKVRFEIECGRFLNALHPDALATTTTPGTPSWLKPPEKEAGVLLYVHRDDQPTLQTVMQRHTRS
jgi:hypothetical protein